MGEAYQRILIGTSVRRADLGRHYTARRRSASPPRTDQDAGRACLGPSPSSTLVAALLANAPI